MRRARDLDHWRCLTEDEREARLMVLELFKHYCPRPLGKLAPQGDMLRKVAKLLLSWELLDPEDVTL